jgi:hypothetical protein
MAILVAIYARAGSPLGSFELAFPCHTFVRLAGALDAVLELAVAAGKLAHHLVIPGSGVTVGKALAEANFLPGTEAVCHGRPQLLITAHEHTLTEFVAVIIRRDRRRHSAGRTAPVSPQSLFCPSAGTNRADAFPRLQPLAMRLALSFEGKLKRFGHRSRPSGGSTTGLSAIGAFGDQIADDAANMRLRGRFGQPFIFSLPGTSEAGSVAATINET